MPLDPKVKKLIEIKGFETNPKMDMKTVRKLNSAKTEFIKNNYPLLIEKIFNIEDLEISLKERKINVRIYKNNKNNNCPLIMYFHGGGWVHGDLDSSDSLCRSLAVRTNAVIVSVEYRLAPEIPFPGAVWDCYDAMVWAIDEKNYLGINPQNIVVSGTSAGGNLAGAVSMLSRDKSYPEISHQILLCPVINCDTNLESYQKYGDGTYGLSTDAVNDFWNKYTQNKQDKNNAYAALDINTNFVGLPTITSVIAEYDCLRDEATNYANLLKLNRIDSDFKIFYGMNHGFNQQLGIIDEAEEALNYICKRMAFN